MNKIIQHGANEKIQDLSEIIDNYAKSLSLLKGYDENNLPKIIENLPIFTISYGYVVNVINIFTQALIITGEASKTFGNECGNGLKVILAKVDAYPTLEEKAAHLLYFIIKDHPFSDGNKRIASLLFIHYLDKNSHLYKANGEMLINDNALVALALLIAESEPKSKELMIALIKNLLAEKN